MNVLAIGTCCVDVYPQKEIVTPGGEALNISVQLSRRDDVRVHLMGLIGRDDYAETILNRIKHFDIDKQHLRQVEGETARHIIHIDHDGDRYFESGSWHGGVSADLRLNDTDRGLLSKMDAVMATLWEPNLAELIELKTAKNYLVAVDFNEQRDFTQWEHLIDRIDIFFSSATDSMKAAFLERSRSSDTIFVLTFGEHRSAAYHRGQTHERQAVEVKEVVDTTGCGDCYQAHFVAEYLKTNDIPLAMKRATLEASKVTAYVGGFPTS